MASKPATEKLLAFLWPVGINQSEVLNNLSATVLKPNSAQITNHHHHHRRSHYDSQSYIYKKGSPSHIFCGGKVYGVVIIIIICLTTMIRIRIRKAPFVFIFFIRRLRPRRWTAVNFGWSGTDGGFLGVMSSSTRFSFHYGARLYDATDRPKPPIVCVFCDWCGHVSKRLNLLLLAHHTVCCSGSVTYRNGTSASCTSMICARFKRIVLNCWKSAICICGSGFFEQTYYLTVTSSFLKDLVRLEQVPHFSEPQTVEKLDS